MTTLTGLWALVRLIVRRDRLRLALWVGGIVGLVVASAASLRPIYPDQAAIAEYVSLFGNNPALVAFAGPGYGFDDPNLGVILVNETQLYGSIAVALMAIFLVNRHTRAEEDNERADLVRSTRVGRHAPITAALVVVSGSCLIVGAVSSAGLVALRYAWGGSLALGAAFAAVGIVFAALGALAAQVASSGRATLGLGAAALAAAFATRAAGDIANNGLSWLSPIGWGQAVRPFAHERWWVFLISGGGAVVLVGLAFVLANHRDLGSGILPQRAGPATAPKWMRQPLGLAFRLQRGTLAAWASALFLLGFVYGSIGDEVEQMVRDNPTYADFLAQQNSVSITDSFFATTSMMLALIGSGFALSTVLRLRSEESAGRAEAFLAHPVARWRWLASYVAVALSGSIIIMGAAGLGTGLAYTLIGGVGGQIPALVGAALAHIPAMFVLSGLAVALFGWSGPAIMGVWAVFAAVVVIGLFGTLLRLPAWSVNLSPFEHVPALPGVAFQATPLLVLGAVGLALVGIGMWAFQRRDVNAT